MGRSDHSRRRIRSGWPGSGIRSGTIAVRMVMPMLRRPS